MRSVFLAVTAFAALCATTATAQDYHPAFQPGQFKGPPAGRVNEVMVLGTPPLSGFPDSFRAEQLDPLLDRLAAWQPNAISVENVSGLQCDAMRRMPARYASAVRSYCYDTTQAQAASGLDVPAATVEVDRLLAEWPQDPTAAQRRQLALMFLAAGEAPSAVVQWLRLNETERVAHDGLTEELVSALNERMVQKNETELVAAKLAARLGLERLWAVDDHTASWHIPAGEARAYGTNLRGVWDNPVANGRKAALDVLFTRVDQPDGMMDIYRDANTPEAALGAYQADFGPNHVEPSEQAYGRRYLSYWEVRNLRMAGHIREVLGREPGTRMLTLVGASHKGYYEAYLDQMHDVKLISTDTVLQ